MERTCPEGFKKVANVLTCNTLSRIQFLEFGCRFVACWCYKVEDDAFFEEIKEKSGCRTLERGVQMLNWYLTIAW
jgi:hypothetical protein